MIPSALRRGPLAPGLRDRVALHLQLLVSWRDRTLRRLGLPMAPDRRTTGVFDVPPLLHGPAAVVRGWALLAGAAPSSVELFAGDRSLGRARIGLPRPDVSFRRPGAEGAVACGFEQMVPTARLPPPGTRFVFEAVVTAFDGGRPLRLQSRETACVAEAPGQRLPAAAVRTKIAADRPLRALVYTHDLGVGGAQHYLQDLLLGLRTRGRVLPAVVAPWDGRLRGELEAHGIPVHLVGAYPFTDVAAYERFIAGECERAGGADLVVANTMGAFAGIDAARRSGCPSAWAIRESVAPPVFWRLAFGSGLDPTIRRHAELALASVIAPVFESLATRDLYARFLPGMPGSVIRPGVDAKTVAARPLRADARRSLGIPETATLLLCLGTVEPRKAQLRLARAFARSAAAYRGAHLAVVGDRDTLYSRALHHVVEASGVKARIHLVPVTPDPLPWLGAADVLVSASDVESLPRSMLEATACGVCIAAVDVFGVGELVTDGESGLLCRENDEVALSGLVARALALTPAARAAMAAAAARRAAAAYCLPTHVEEWERLLLRIAGRGLS